MVQLRSLIVLAALIGCCLADGAPYSFNYQAHDEGQHQRNEQGQHGEVQGSYSYIDPNGHLRQVNYIANEDGFQPSGDIGIDRETEAAAADLASQNPPSDINYSPPGASGGSYGGSSNTYGSGSKGYSAPRPPPRPQYAPRPAPKFNYQAPKPQYQSPAKTGYQQQQQPWKQPQKSSYQPQQQDDSYGSGPAQDTYSYNTQITHSQPPRSSYGKPASPASYGKPRPQKPSYKQAPIQQQQEDGSYDHSQDWSEPSGPRQSIAYEVRAPTHKIIAKYN